MFVGSYGFPGHWVSLLKNNFRNLTFYILTLNKKPQNHRHLNRRHLFFSLNGRRFFIGFESSTFRHFAVSLKNDTRKEISSKTWSRWYSLLNDQNLSSMKSTLNFRKKKNVQRSTNKKTKIQHCYSSYWRKFHYYARLVWTPVGSVVFLKFKSSVRLRQVDNFEDRISYRIYRRCRHFPGNV